LCPCSAIAQGYTLDAPDEAHIRQSIDIGWTAPQPDGGLIEIRGIAPNGRRLTYAYVRGNPQAVTAPDQPGSYEIVYIHEREVRASHPLSVVLPQASIAAQPNAGAGEDIVITFSGPMSQGDQITFAQRDGDLVRGTAYFYVANADGDTVTLRAPNDAGAYDVVYRTGKTILARAPVTVGAVSAAFEAPAQIHAGGVLRFRWSGPENEGDLISFATPGGERIPATSYQYVANTDGENAALTAPETVGTYDVVYLSGGRIIGRATIEVVPSSITLNAPPEVLAGMEFHAQWAGAGNQGDQIRLFDAAGTEAEYQYVDPLTGTVRIIAPEVPGTYELAYLTRGDREMARRPITVISPPEEPGLLYVSQEQASLGPGDAVEIILDASGSMLQRLDGERRIDIARATLNRLVSEIVPPETGFALRVFGHREADSCRTDLEIPLGALQPAAAAETVSRINAMNLARTPIADSIARVPNDLAGVAGQRVLIVLTDGEETCDGDPALAIQALRDQGLDIRVNIVGFAIDDEELRETFRSWAAAGGGDYFNATNGEELDTAMTRAVATPFTIVDTTGREVAAGLTGGDAITLQPGRYTLARAGGQMDFEIGSGESLSLVLE